MKEQIVVRPLVRRAAVSRRLIAPDGSFFIVDDGNNRIERFDAAHKLVKAWGSFGAGDGQRSSRDLVDAGAVDPGWSRR